MAGGIAAVATVSGGDVASSGSASEGRRSERRRGRPELFWGFVAFAIAVIIAVAMVRRSDEPPQADEPAPQFTLTSASGAEVSLSGLLDQHDNVVLVFYRGFF